MKSKEVLQMNDKELQDKLNELKNNLFLLRFQNAIGQLSNPKKITETRKDIARVKTAIRQRELASKKG